MAVTPFHFGDSDRTLYGVFHHPEQRVQNAPAVLLLNPFGEEAIRAFRIFKILAERFARSGAAVLRFDYYGAGDSYGVDGDVDLTGMIADALMAHDELEAMSAKRNFVWVGLGLGASVAALAAAESGVRLRQLFLWDGVASGADYLSSLRRAHIDFLSDAMDAPESALLRGAGMSDDMQEAIGFEVSLKLVSELAALDLASCASPRSKEVHFIASKDAPNDSRLVVWARAGGSQISQYEDASVTWNSDEALNSYTTPTDVIDYIVREARKTP